MAIEINGNEKNSLSFDWLFQLLFALAILVLLSSIAVFVYYQFFNIQPKTNTLMQLKTDIQNDKTQKEKTTEIEAAAIQNYVDDFVALYEQRPKMSGFFSGAGFEGWVHPNVYFSNFSIDADSRVVNLKGYTTDFKPLIDQLKIFKDLRNRGQGIENYEVSDIKLAEEGGVSFSLVITVSPDTIKPKTIWTTNNPAY
ncbi:hypothetical protein M0R01_03275 [bacterium]|nr:hypothetical protein [bacterium]